MNRTTCPDNSGHVRKAVDGHTDGQPISRLSGVRQPDGASKSPSNTVGPLPGSIFLSTGWEGTPESVAARRVGPLAGQVPLNGFSKVCDGGGSQSRQDRARDRFPVSPNIFHLINNQI